MTTLMNKLQKLKCKTFYFLIALLFLSSLNVQAEINCDDDTKPIYMNECANMQFKEADAELNQLYSIIVSRLKTSDAMQDNEHNRGMADVSLLDKLKKSQRLWIQFRDAECKIAAHSVYGGSIEPVIYSECLTKITQKRNEELLKYTLCDDYDFTCPFPTADGPMSKGK
ncbi:lysozyme inhibitor LprI family protein [Thorsellia kenyensis]|uniref:Lysozyme inhibitor LprI family protein n=1 Tax=Thorsellia kenyensis TaxID=1549888 RepID=A0ABV6C7J2_9GAMM